MIKNTVTDPLQEEMLVKKFNEECAAVGESEYGFGEAADMMYTVETVEAFNALMESVGIAELQFYNKYGVPLVMKEAGEGEKADSGEEAKTDEAPAANAEEKGTSEKAKQMDADAKKAGGNFVARIKKILDNIIGFIQKLWNSAKQALQEMDLANKAFAAKYGAQLSKSEYKDKTVTLGEGYEFHLNVASEALKKLQLSQVEINNLAKKVSSGKGNMEAAKKAVSMFILHANSIDEFKKKLSISKKGPQDTPTNAINNLKTTGNLIKTANAEFAKATAAINKFKGNVSADDTGKAAAELFVYASNLAKSILSAYIETIKLKSRQDRAICVHALKWRAGDNKRAKETAKAEKAAAKEAKNNANGAENAGEGEANGEGETQATGESARLQNLSVNDMLEMFSFV